jgi:hypothetical protein
MQPCNFVILAARRPQSRTVSRAPVYQILWVRGFRAHTISGRGFNLFKPLRRHFRATPSRRQALSRRDPGDGNASVQKIDDRLGDLRRDGGTGILSFERLWSYATEARRQTPLSPTARVLVDIWKLRDDGEEFPRFLISQGFAAGKISASTRARDFGGDGAT